MQIADSVLQFAGIRIADRVKTFDQNNGMADARGFAKWRNVYKVNDEMDFDYIGNLCRRMCALNAAGLWR
jgi:hypothetical protein